MSAWFAFRSAKGMRPRRVRLRVESLESRCLLSLAPAGDTRLVDPSLPDKQLSPPPLVDSLPPTRDPYAYPPSGSQPEGDDDEDSYDKPTESNQGGPINLGDFTKPALETGGTKSNDESTAVLAVLAGLSFVQRSDPAAAAAADAIFATLDPAASATSAEPTKRSEGGTIAIARSPLSPTTAAPAPADLDLSPWPTSPVQMEGARGRFRAFEISTIAPPAASRHEPPIADCTAISARDDSTRSDEESLPGGMSRPEADADALIRSEPADEAEDAPQFPLLPIAIDDRTSLWLNAVAAAILFAYLTRAARSETRDSRAPLSVVPWGQAPELG